MSYPSSGEWDLPRAEWSERPPAGGGGQQLGGPSSGPSSGQVWSMSSSINSDEFHRGWDTHNTTKQLHTSSSDRSSFSSGSSSGVLHLDIEGAMPSSSSSGFEFSTTYFQSNTAPPPPNSIFGSPGVTLKPRSPPTLSFSAAPSRSPPQPVASTSGSSSEAPAKAPPMSRYAQLVQTKLRNVAAAAAAKEAALASTGPSSSLSSLGPSSKVDTRLVPQAYPYQPATAAWPIAQGPAAEQMHADVTQGQTVCNPTFMGYSNYAYDAAGTAQLSGPGVISGEMGPGHNAPGPSSVSASSLLALSLDGDLAMIKTGRPVSPMSSSSSASSRRKEKRKRQSVDLAVEDDGLWGQRRPSPPPASDSDYLSPSAHPSASTSIPISSVPQPEPSNWLPASSSPAVATYQTLASSSSHPADTGNYFPSAYQPNTGYAALAPPVVGSYPTGTDTPWWTRIDLGQATMPRVNASYVHSAYPGLPASQDQQGPGLSSMYGQLPPEPMPDYSFLGAIDARQQDPRLVTSRHASSVNGEMTRYQQLIAAKYSSAPISTVAPPTPAPVVAAPVQQPDPVVASSSSVSCPSQSPTISPHLMTANPTDYSQYPRATPSALFAPEPRPANDYSQPSSTSSPHFAKDASTRFPSYFPSSTSQYGQSYTAYQNAAAMSSASGQPGSWSSALYDGALRRDASSSSWETSPAESSSSASSAPQMSSSYSSSSNLSTLSPYPARIDNVAASLLPPTPMLSSSYLAAQPPTPSPGSQASQLPMSSLLLPSYLNTSAYVPIAARPPQPSLASLASSPSSSTLSLSASSQTVPTPPSPYDRPLVRMAPTDPRHPASATISSGSSSTYSAMLPPPVPMPRHAPTISADDWNSVTAGPAPKPKKVKGEPREYSVPSHETIRRGSSEGSFSAPSTDEVPMTVTERDGKRKLMLACHFCRGRKLKCDGNRVQCGHCVARGTPCTYDQEVRRRGPGRKKIRIGEDGEEIDPRPPGSTASKPTKMKGVGSGHGQKMTKWTDEEREGGTGVGGGKRQKKAEREESLEVAGWRG